MHEPIVATKNGRLRGTRVRNIDGGEYIAFKGIPYGKPPIGKLRFSDPEPAEPWTGVRDATEHGDNAVQWHNVLRSIWGSEDCLHLNVYTNTIDEGTRLPVMVYIHGGAFVYGSGDSDIYSPDYLLKHNVVVVTINYRLGIFGFLNLEDEVAPGNQGFKDQVLALQWILENISVFGGDPTNVTLFGESAGSASVHYLALSPLSKGLFHKAISQSGVPLNPWAFTPDNPSQYAHELCEILGQKSRDPGVIIEFLRQADFKDLLKAQEQIQFSMEKYTLRYPFGPGIDAKSNKPFMPKNPRILVESLVDIPFLIGYTSQEGAISVAGKTEKDYTVIDSNFAEMMHPRVLKLLAEKQINPLDLKRYYYGSEAVSITNRETYAKMCSDLYFKHGIMEVWKIQSKSPSPTYCYRFSYDKATTFIKRIFSLENMSGACHADDLDYLFHQPIRSSIGLDVLQKGSSGYKLMKRLTTMWTNFAKTGNPTPEITDMIPIVWPAITRTKLNYLDINENFCVESLPINYDLFDEIISTISKL